MKVYLIGYMGVGKTTLGKKLAAKLGLPFYDLDAAIEEKAGMKIASIFAEKGEAHFRELEHKTLIGFTKSSEALLLSTGGGAPLHHGNMELLLQSGIVVWLQLSPEMIASRILKNPDKRPILHGVAPVDLPGFIERHLEKRLAVYEKAHLRVETEGMNAERVDELAVRIKKKADTLGGAV